MASRDFQRIVRDEAVRALEIIRDHTDPNSTNNYRADDRDGCLDGVFAHANQALAYIALIEAAPAPQPGML